MNNAVIIQQVYSDSEYALMVAQVFQRHMEYCLKWHFDYQFILGDVDTRYPKEMGGWAKIPLIQKALVDYEYVVYLDADTYIADMDVDLRDAIQYGIGAVIYNNPIVQYCVGDLFIHRSEEVRIFLTEWMMNFPGPKPWREQEIFNSLCMIYHGAIVKPIDVKWDSAYLYWESEHPVIQAFHGHGTVANRMMLMAEDMKKRRK